MPIMGFESTTPALDRAKTVPVLYRAFFTSTSQKTGIKYSKINHIN
jgi:hypothetical protein